MMGEMGPRLPVQAGPQGAGATKTTAAPINNGFGSFTFAVADTGGFALNLPFFCGDGTNSASGTVTSIPDSTHVICSVTGGAGVTSIALRSPFTYTGTQGPQGAPGAAGRNRSWRNSNNRRAESSQRKV